MRVARLKSSLRKETDVTTALYEAGYGSASRLYERSNAQLGMTPATYRRGGRGMNLSYTIANSTLGRVLVAATDRGGRLICVLPRSRLGLPAQVSVWVPAVPLDSSSGTLPIECE